MLFDSDGEGHIPLGLFLTYADEGGTADATPPRLQASEPPVRARRSHFTTSKES